MNTALTMYVLVRLDLSDSYRMAQGTHAVVEYAIDNVDKFIKWDNGRIVFLGVQGLRKLEEMNLEIMKRGVTTSMYHEPDLEGQSTAIACVCEEFDEYIFKDLKAA